MGDREPSGGRQGLYRGHEPEKRAGEVLEAREEEHQVTPMPRTMPTGRFQKELVLLMSLMFWSLKSRHLEKMNGFTQKKSMPKILIPDSAHI